MRANPATWPMVMWPMVILLVVLSACMATTEGDSHEGHSHEGGLPGEDLGEGDGSEVVIIGDSWMRTGEVGIGESLMVAAGKTYRSYARPGALLLDPGPRGIPQMYAQARADDPAIATVLMNGGLNDPLMLDGILEDCRAMGPRCGALLDDYVETLRAMWAEMATDGVHDVVYVEYSGATGGGDYAQLGDNRLRDACAAAPLRCHTLPTGRLIDGDFLADGIHPTEAAYGRVGAALHQLMVEHGMRR